MQRNRFSYNQNEYLIIVSKFSKTKRLLVEGRDDKKFFKILFNQFKFDNVKIDTAENLIDFKDNNGNIIKKNRQKVETICNSLNNKSCNDNFVGFVDREFDEFDINTTIYDKLISHKVKGRLVCSRGHSIENYFFDFYILCESLRDLCDTEYFFEALNIFSNLIESTLRLACAASLAGKEIGDQGNFSLIKGSIKWELIEIRDSKAILLIDKWQKSLESKTNEGLAKKIIERYQYWLEIVYSSNLDDVRWICHGHIGIAVIWAVYSFCVYDICRDDKEVSRILSIRENNRTHACASWWARKAIGNHCDYPREIFKLLGFI